MGVKAFRQGFRSRHQKHPDVRDLLDLGPETAIQDLSISPRTVYIKIYYPNISQLALLFSGSV